MPRVGARGVVENGIDQGLAAFHKSLPPKGLRGL
jgi:hypothetical protein